MGLKKKEVLTLRVWVAQMGGSHKVGKLLNVQPSTVRHWCASNSYPRWRQMAKIRKVSKGTVSFDAIIDHHYGKN